MSSTASPTRPLPRWLWIPGLWLLLSVIFSSQLFLAGHVTPWSRALAAEAMYWLTWGVLAPGVFFLCRRLHAQRMSVCVAGLLLGAIAAVALQPIVAEILGAALGWLGRCVGGDCQALAGPFADEFFTRAVRVAAVNLPVYAGFVLAWLAGTYYRESRDREMKALALESSLQHAQLQALRSQLNPHFLFNALHSIAELVHANPGLAEKLVVRLGELLRQVLQSSASQEVALAEELEFIRGFVEIEQMRLGERLQVRWDVDPEALKARVPSLILQPLVENAIQHGISASAQAGALRIRAYRDGEFLILQVHDTGPGLVSEEPGQRTGIGLANTRIRLQSLYGDRQSLDLADEQGLTVNVRIPLTTA